MNERRDEVPRGFLRHLGDGSSAGGPAGAQSDATVDTVAAIDTGNFGEGCDNFPSVAIASPGKGAHLNGAVAFDVNASDDKGVVTVQFFIDDKLVTEDSSYLYRYTWASDEVDERPLRGGRAALLHPALRRR